MSNILKWSFKNALIGMGAVFCAFVVIAAFLAPALASMKVYVVSDFLYNFLHKLCKVHGSKHFLITGHAVAICARCVGGYISGFLVQHLYLHKFKMDKVIYIILGTLAFGEIAGEYFNLFYANEFVRLIDGLCLGAFLGMTFIKILDWLEGKRGW